MKQKILLWDIETAPNLGYIWGKYEQNVLEYVKEWELLSFSYKWLGEKKIHCVTRQGQKDDKAIAKKLHALLSEADVVVAHNGDEFDAKRARAKFIEHGLPPPKPFQSVDTLKIAKSRFKFNSNRLNDLGKLLGVGSKVKTGGFDLWLGCMNDDPKSWRLMEKYNRQDVTLLEKVYLKLRPWADKHPHQGVRGLDQCPKCGSGKLHKRGLMVSAQGVQYRRLQCQGCGGWCRARLAEKDKARHGAV
jgi:DNA polymerase elongation subunit (family B)